jgi:hypothetical protein
VSRRVPLVTCAALLTCVAFGCLDAIAPGHGGGRSGSIGLMPVFEGAESGGIPGDVDLIRLTIHDPPSPDTTIDRPVTPGQEEISVSVPVSLNGAVDSVVVRFQAIRSSDNTVLYSGADTVAVGAGLPTTATPIVAVYVGPGKNVLSISIAPTAVSLKPGDTVAFDVVALDSSDATIVGMPALFASRDPSRVTVNAAGVARAVSVGTSYVVVMSGARASVRDSALVTVSAAPQALIALAPASVNIVDTVGTADPAARFVTVTNTGGGTLGGLAVGTLTYGASQPGGWLFATLNGTTAPTTLNLQATKGGLPAGTYTVTVPVQSAAASNSPQSVSVTFQIVAAATPLASMTVTPGFRVMLLGDTVTLQAAGKDSAGNPVATPGLAFVSRTPAVASVGAASGKVTAVAGGSTVVAAQSGSVGDSALVVVASTGSAVVSALAGGRYYGTVKVGDTVTVQVAVDLRAVPTEVLGSYDAVLNWNSATLRYVRSDSVAGGFAAPTINEAQTATGTLRFGSADPNGVPGQVAVIQVKFVAAASGGSPLTITLSDLSAAKTFTNLLAAAALVSGQVTVR